MKHTFETLKNISYHILLLAFISLTFSACQKEGPVGPQGPEGPTGRDGNDNVSSFYYTIFENEWEEFGDPGVGFGYIAGMDFPEITEDILNHGAVLVYLYQEGSLYSLPTTFVNPGDGGYLTTIWTTLQLGQVLVTFQDSDGLTVNPGDQEFKVVIIEGGIVIPESLNLKNFNEVKEFFNL